jgi:hypothetical protein
MRRWRRQIGSANAGIFNADFVVDLWADGARRWIRRRQFAGGGAGGG